jgi:Dyp-type peroxidase family
MSATVTEVPTSPASAPAPDPRAIQGNVVGFNKDHQRLVFLHFNDVGTARSFVGALEPNIASGYEVRGFNDLYKEVRARRGGEKGIIQASWTNIAFTFTGLQLLGPSGLDAFPQDFRDGMAARAAELGDLDQSAPGAWLAPFDQPQQVHAVVILAADDPGDLEASYTRLQTKIENAGAITELGRQDGNVRPDPERGHEHFGFKDGISQPAIRGVTTSSKNPNKTIEPGEFLIGYPDETGHVSGQPEPAGPPPEPGQPGYGQPTPAPLPAMPPWAKDGSFVVYRRLRQDVGAFKAFVEQQAPPIGLDAGRLGAKLVGRWASGAPMEHVPGLPHGVDPWAADPSTTHPQTLDDDHINAFGYADDPDGTRVPRAAHIRKSYPRDQANPGQSEADRHRILRRGIPYGPEFQPTEQPYGTGPVTDDRDRGLVFLCYQSSIARGFAFIQQAWVNTRDFPQVGDGEDPIISQVRDPREFNLPPQPNHLQMARWVFTTGGDYLFSPSIPALRQLAQGGA